MENNILNNIQNSEESLKDNDNTENIYNMFSQSEENKCK